MRLKGITEDGIHRLARVVGQQEPDYGDSSSPEVVQQKLDDARARWTSEGWVADADLDLSGCGLTRLPLIKYVDGSFYCWMNDLTSLEGAPQKIGGDFDCSGNSITSLNGGPLKVGGTYSCNSNQLTSLEGGPKYVGRNFRCKGNPIESLDGLGDVVGEIASDLSKAARNSSRFDSFVEGFIDAMLQTTSPTFTHMTEEEQEEEYGNLDRSLMEYEYDVSDISDKCIEKMIDECDKFRDMAGDLISQANDNGMSDSDIGSDFWLTRNRHGAGFWDGDYGDKELGEKLTDIAHKFSELWPTIDENEEIHVY